MARRVGHTSALAGEGYSRGRKRGGRIRLPLSCARGSGRGQAPAGLEAQEAVPEAGSAEIGRVGAVWPRTPKPYLSPCLALGVWTALRALRRTGP